MQYRNVSVTVPESERMAITMKKSFIRGFTALLLSLYLLPTTSALAWTDQAHMAMGMAAGFRRFQNCAGIDISNTVAAINGLPQTDEQAHFFNAPADYEITADDAYDQLQYIGKSREDCPDGYLLGAILHTVRLCKEKTESGAFDDEYYAVLLHYITDLSQPLHMTVYDDFNRSCHFACDDILSDAKAKYPVFASVKLAKKLKVNDKLRFETEEELLEAVIELAGQSQELANNMRREQRNITRKEALLQVSRAATLGKAAMRYCGKIK